LRSPVLGLSINSLFKIFHEQPVSPWFAIMDYAENLAPEHEQKALKHLITTIKPALAASRRIPLRRLVESTWLQLYAPATLSKTQLANTDVYFNLLASLDDGAQVDISILQQRLQKLYAKPESKPHADQVELLTMHGAKGLQWDTVILCGLGKTPRAKDKEVLVQTEVSSHQGQQFLLSPLPHHGHDAMYDLIRDLEKQRDVLEVARLLYVACTRAKTELHMFGEVRGEKQQPASSSLLALLWQDEGECFGADVMIHPAITSTTQEKTVQNNPQKLPASFIAPQPYAAISSQQTSDESLNMNIKPEFSWAGAQAKAVGIAIHAALQKIAERGLSRWENANDAQITQLMRHCLYHEGISHLYLEKALQRCQKGLERCHQSARLRWILDEEHQEQHNEWALTCVQDGQCKHIILDRSFIDEDGVRWVIDYKTGSHFEDDIDVWLDQELYRYTVETPQLPNYVNALQALEPNRIIKAALYFPMMDAWREWQ
jgi:ATP-dependent exoDNAse (exonuclease V) beta subunit